MWFLLINRTSNFRLILSILKPIFILPYIVGDDDFFFGGGPGPDSRTGDAAGQKGRTLSGRIQVGLNAYSCASKYLKFTQQKLRVCIA